MTALRLVLPAVAIVVSPVLHAAANWDAGVEQLIVSVALEWDSVQGQLQCFERTSEGWRPVSRVMPVLYGHQGIAWGRGLLGADEVGPKKVEGDGRAPAGIFALGPIYTEDERLPEGADFPMVRVTAADAWIDDPAHPRYNQHVRVDLRDPPPWFERQKMRLGDPAFRWRIEIRHNTDPPVPGAGSAIFFHLRRSETRPTAGCTALAEEDLVWMIRWLRVKKNPRYVLLPAGEYERRREAWSLPALPPGLRRAGESR